MVNIVQVIQLVVKCIIRAIDILATELVIKLIIWVESLLFKRLFLMG